MFPILKRLTWSEVSPVESVAEECFRVSFYFVQYIDYCKNVNSLAEVGKLGSIKLEGTGRTSNYYQVLIDGRDSPPVTQGAQKESVTFLGNHDQNSR